MTGTDMPRHRWGVIDKSALTSRMPIRDTTPLPVAKLPGQSIKAYIEEPSSEPASWMSDMLRNVRDRMIADENSAVIELLRTTPGDERGIEVTHTSYLSNDAFRFGVTAARSDNVPAGTIGRRYETEHWRP